jgi:hypothetical protein
MNRKLKALMLCSVFAVALTGCDKIGIGGSNAPEKQDVAVTQVVPPAVKQDAAPVLPAPAAQPEKKAAEPDERTFSNGERVGHVTKFSFKSSPQRLEGDDLELCKNWEGELSMENTVANNAVGAGGVTNGSNAFSFSIGKGRNDIVKKVQGALRSGHKVSLQYNQVVRHDECKSRTDYYVVGVKDLEPTPPKVVQPPPAPVVKAPANLNSGGPQ